MSGGLGKLEESISLESSFVRKAVFGLVKSIAEPRLTLSWILRGHLAKDQLIVNQTYWFTGTLPRVPLTKILPGIENVEVQLPRAFDRRSGTSISVEEASHVAAVTRFKKARKVLEIGTYDGNTALVLASNLAAPDGSVVTVDLPPDFSKEQQSSLAHTDVEFNLTERDQLGRQSKGHPRIRQVHGDSGELDWSTLGGPFDVIFIDGCHSEPYVRADTQNALKQLAPGGVILWHDYGLIPDVSRVVDEVARQNKSLKTFAIEGTRLALALS